MKILQNPISEEHKSAMFFDGVVATGEKDGKKYTLKTFQDGELVFWDDLYIGAEIRELAETRVGKSKHYLINDVDVDEEETVDIHVDKFLAITEEGVEVDTEKQDNIYNDFDEAVEAFKNFLGE